MFSDLHYKLIMNQKPQKKGKTGPQVPDGKLLPSRAGPPDCLCPCKLSQWGGGLDRQTAPSHGLGDFMHPSTASATLGDPQSLSSVQQGQWTEQLGGGGVPRFPPPQPWPHYPGALSLGVLPQASPAQPQPQPLVPLALGQEALGTLLPGSSLSSPQQPRGHVLTCGPLTLTVP